MLPYYTYRDNPIFSIKFQRNFLIYIKENLLYILLYFYPRLLAKFYDLIFQKKIFRKYKFVRSDCDHFGSWIFLLLCLRQKQENNKDLFFCLAKKNSINKNLLTYFNKYNLIIIYNPILQFLISPLFFTLKNSIDVNGHFPLSYIKNNIIYPDFSDIGPINEIFLKKVCINKKKINSKINFFGNKKGLVLFYPRLGNWLFSTRNSKRNMPLKIAKILIQEISKSYDLILLGNTFKYFSELQNNIYDFDNLLKSGISPHDIFSSSDCIIGSISGATHFPSLLYNLPTLYIGDIPLDHLLAIYNIIPKSKNNKHQIPKKDKWLILDFDAQNNIDNFFWKKVIKEFMYKYELGKNCDFDPYILESEICSFRGEPPYNLKLSEKGNLYLHKSYLTK